MLAFSQKLGAEGGRRGLGPRNDVGGHLIVAVFFPQ